MRWPEIEREGRLRVRNSLGVKLWFSIFTSANMAAPPAKPSPQPQQDALYYLLSDLRTRDPAQQKAGANALCEYVLWETRDLRGEGFTGFMDRLYGRLRAMIESADELENIGGVCAIDALIDWKLGEHSAKLNKLDSFLRYVFEVKREEDTLLLAGNAFGHLLKVGNTVTSGLTAKTVDEMVTLALDWLVENSPHKLAAAIILKAVAESSPTIFNTSVPMFNEKIWIALHDENKAVRERAAEALGACLRIVQTRETRWRAQRYFRLFERTDFGMRKQASPESIHGSLIAIRELLQGAGEFMMARYQVVANIVLRFKHHKDPLIRRTITELVPMIALYLKAKFLTEYLEKYMQYLMDVMKNPSERASGFVALGGMANRVGISLVPYLDEIFVLLRDAIVPRKGPVCPEALICVGKLAQAIGKKMEDHVKDLLPAMLQGGLSPALVESLSAISSSLKDLDIEESLIRLVDSVLIKEEGAKAQSLSSALTGSHESVNSSIVQLALRTLGSFRLELPIPVFKQKTWKVVLYLEDADPLIRQEAAVTSCKLIASVVKFRPSPGDPDFRRSIRWEKIEATIFEIVKKLMVAVIDTEPGVRKAFMSCLLSTEALHEFIFHEDCVFPLFISLKDEVFEIRELAIKVLGRIRNRNPAFILSRMRDHRQYLLGGLDIMLDVKTREECTKLLGVLMRSCPEAVSCDYPTILETLISKLREAMLIESSPARGHGLCGNCGVVTSTLATLGDLSEVGGSELRQHLKDLLPLIVQALQDDKVPGKQRVAVMTLGKVLQSTGFAVNPIMSYPEPLLSLERLLNPTGDWALQREVMHVWGMLGVDPHLYKHGMRNTSSRLQMQSPAAAQSQSKERTSAAITTAIDETPIDLLCSATFSTSNEDFYPTVATNALLRVVMNSSTVSSQKLAITSLVSVLKVLGPQGCAPYLAKVMTGFFHIFRTCEDGLKGLMLEQLCEIVMIVRKPIHPYLRDLMAIILQEWSNLPLLTGVQTLLKKLYLAVNTPSLFEPYMPEVLPRCMQQLADAERSGDLPIVRSTLHMLEVFTVGFSMVHVHWVVPAVVRMFKGDVGSASVEIRREALQSLARLIDRLCKTHSVSGLVQSFFVPLIRVIAGPEESLRGVALDVLCIFAAMDVRQFGFALPAVTRIVEPLQLQHDQFRQLAVEMKERRWVQIDAIKAQLLKKVSVVEGLEMEAVDNGGPVEDLEESVPPLKMDVHKLKNASEAWNLSMREDWDEWMRQLSVKLLKESPSPALRSCAELAREQPSVAKELFSAAFVSCWTEMKPPSQEQLVTWFEHAFISLSISTETLNILLNLAEFMDRDEKPLPVHLSKLATLAEKVCLFLSAINQSTVLPQPACDVGVGRRAVVEGVCRCRQR
ncbi:hypothetical protein CBR_g23926 [Chara braunii]|uniref:Serine/threonine-protein kinase TOR n=1 Tax=Chara braunii TaxID=69332 RepID=A0A388L579_CHABU|nr:hypothetical protein CBR_g23926 [Chara braunii]|eukprot:GBG77479.1 hypothetical protein CBR_g23926 [Chara braunii]